MKEVKKCLDIVGKILRVNLLDESYKVEELPDNYIRNYIGGKRL